MTTQAKPKFQKTTYFNSSFYNTEINNDLKDYVNYDPTNTKLISNVNYIPTDITSLTLTTIGQNDMINNQFNLPTNTFEANPKSVLQLVSNSSRNTTWATPATVITDYTNYDNTNKTLISNVSGTTSTITDLVISNSLGSSIAQKFILPSNSSTGVLNSVLTLSNITTKATTWTQIPTQISNYVNYSNPNLISNVSGTPTTISNLTVGPLICTTINNQSNTLSCGNITSGTINSGAINANANLIETTGSLQSRGLSIRNVNNVEVATIASTGSLIAKSLQAKAFTIKDTNDLDSATITSSGALVCTTIQNNNNTLNCGNITSGTINSGAINANANLIETTGNLQSRGLTIKNTSNADVATISNLGAISSLSLNTLGNINCALIDVASTVYCRYLAVRDTLNTFDIIQLLQNGTIQGQGLTIKNTSNVDVATISNLGALVCTSIQNNNNTLNCGNITSGTINSGAINANANLIETTGNLQSRGLTIKNTSNADVATISNLGALSCTSITSNNNTISAGNGAISTTTLNSSTVGGVLDIGANQTTGALSIGNNAGRTGAINIGTLVTGAHAINIGNSASTQTVTINRPLTTNTISTNNNTISAGTGAISTTTLNSSTIGGVLDIGANQTTGALSIGNNAGRTGAINIGTLTTGAHAINIGNSSSTQTVTINRPLTTNTIDTNNNTISSGTGAISTTTLNSSTVGGVLDIGSNQTTGALSIGNNAGRTGAVNIATLTTGTNSINIGNSASTQTININRPIRLPGFIYSAGNEIGYSLNNSTTFSTATGNPTLSGTAMKTTIPTTNLILNANYLIKYSLTIAPLADFNVTKFQYGLYTTGFITSCSNNIAVLSGTTTITSTRFSTTDTYAYSGSGFFRYDNPTTPYTFAYLMTYLATAPVIVTNIDLIRIS